MTLSVWIIVGILLISDDVVLRDSYSASPRLIASPSRRAKGRLRKASNHLTILIFFCPICQISNPLFYSMTKPALVLIHDFRM